MLLVSQMIFIGNEAPLLYVTVWERASVSAVTTSVLLFNIAYAITKFSCCGALFKCILAWERGISKRYYLE